MVIEYIIGGSVAAVVAAAILIALFVRFWVRHKAGVYKLQIKISKV